MFIIRCLSPRLLNEAEKRRVLRSNWKPAPDLRPHYVMDYEYDRGFQMIEFEITTFITLATTFRRILMAQSAIKRISTTGYSIKLFGFNAKYEVERFYPEVYNVMES